MIPASHTTTIQLVNGHVRFVWNGAPYGPKFKSLESAEAFKKACEQLTGLDVRHLAPERLAKRWADWRGK